MQQDAPLRMLWHRQPTGPAQKLTPLSLRKSSCEWANPLVDKVACQRTKWTHG